MTLAEFSLTAFALLNGCRIVASGDYKNVPDPRNWQGSGNRSVANMFIDLGQQVSLSEDQFQQEMADRRATHTGDVIIGCPLCNVPLKQSKPASTPSNQQRQQ